MGQRGRVPRCKVAKGWNMKHVWSRSPRARKVTGAAAAAALIATGAVGAQSLAEDVEPGSPPQPPGVPVDIPSSDELAEKAADAVIGVDRLIETGGTTFDETVLTKYIPASAFQPFQGPGGALDLVRPNGGACLTPGEGSGGLDTFMQAPAELPDGALINRVSFFGIDDDEDNDISVRLRRLQVNTDAAEDGSLSSTRVTTTVDGFSTEGASSEVLALSGGDELAESAGSPEGVDGRLLNRFHTIDVTLKNENPGAHVICGVVVEYQIAVSSEAAGVVFHPIEPVRAFDSRRDAFEASGVLEPNSSKIVSVANGHTATGTPIPSQADSVPENATAVTYNVTVAGATGPNFVAVTSGDAESFGTSAVNYVAGVNTANAGTVEISQDRTIALWGGEDTGSAHVIVDITGYYAPAPPFPNMAG